MLIIKNKKYTRFIYLININKTIDIITISYILNLINKIL